MSLVEQYLKLSRRWAASHGPTRKRRLANEMHRLYEQMTADQRAELNARWRDPN